MVFTERIACIPGILSKYPGIPSATDILIPIYLPPYKMSSIWILADFVSPSPASASSPIEVPVSAKLLFIDTSVCDFASVFTVFALYLNCLFTERIISGPQSIDCCITMLHVLSASGVTVVQLIEPGIRNDKSNAAPNAITRRSLRLESSFLIVPNSPYLNSNSKPITSWKPCPTDGHNKAIASVPYSSPVLSPFSS